LDQLAANCLFQIDGRIVPRFDRQFGGHDSVCRDMSLPFVIDVSAFQMLLIALTGWLGLANHASRRAWVFCGRIVTQVTESSTVLSRTIGYVLAHEVGHLILPEYSHASDVLMGPLLPDHINTGCRTCGIDPRARGPAAGPL
jgi:hypothetical protein